MKYIDSIIEAISYAVGFILLSPILIVWKAIENNHYEKEYQQHLQDEHNREESN